MKQRIISIQTEGNPLLDEAVKIINENQELKTLWVITNVTAKKRAIITDHGIVHFNIVANLAFKIMRLLKKNNVVFSITKDYRLSYDYAELVVFLASVCHDLGMSVHRNNHEEYSLFITHNLLREILLFLPIKERVIVISEVLHAIVSHRKDGMPFTLEAGIVRLADALDMTEGRSRLDYDESKLDIYSVSALAIDEVEVKKGKDYPVQINITMNHTAGIFQIDELLKKKLSGSGIEKYLEVKIYINNGKGKRPFKEIK